MKETKWRLLNLGETIQRGDMYFDQHWIDHEEFHYGKEVTQGHYPIKRKLTDNTVIDKYKMYSVHGYGCPFYGTKPLPPRSKPSVYECTCGLDETLQLLEEFYMDPQDMSKEEFDCNALLLENNHLKEQMNHMIHWVGEFSASGRYGHLIEIKTVVERLKEIMKEAPDDSEVKEKYLRFAKYYTGNTSSIKATRNYRTFHKIFYGYYPKDE